MDVFFLHDGNRDHLLLYFLSEVVFKEPWREELVCKLTIVSFGSCCQVCKVVDFVILGGSKNAMMMRISITILVATFVWLSNKSTLYPPSCLNFLCRAISPPSYHSSRASHPGGNRQPPSPLLDFATLFLCHLAFVAPDEIHRYH